jgi:hypothetical protein
MTRQSAPAASTLTAAQYIAALREQLAPLPVNTSSNSLSFPGSSIAVYLDTNSLRQVRSVEVRGSYADRARHAGIHRFTKVADVTYIARQLIRIVGEDRVARASAKAAQAQLDAQLLREKAVVARLQPMANAINELVKSGVLTVARLEGDSRPNGDVEVSMRLNGLSEAQAVAVLALLAGPVVAPEPVERQPLPASVGDRIRATLAARQAEMDAERQVEVCGAPGGVGVSCRKDAGHDGPHGDWHESWR